MTPLENLTLDDLCADVTRLLQKHRLLDRQQDGRVSSAPDARTVRYYQQLGLVDSPRIVDREARYGWRQVLQLLAVKALQQMGLPLAQIQKRLIARTDAELEQVLRALAEDRNVRPKPPQTVAWREVVLEPGVRLMVEDGWSAPKDTEALARRIAATLAALSNAPQNGGTTR
jgi:DNA-binding transcriptional MerR regulator